MTALRRVRHVIRVNERVVARSLGWHRSTVGRAIKEPEESGEVALIKRIKWRGMVFHPLPATAAEPFISEIR